jgi:RNA polymerase sigma factor (sigma-70 family)
MTDDAELLRRYAAEKSDAAFAELVRRRVDFVYNTALRQSAGNRALAEDVTQMVFIDLARKATTLVRHPALVGWLHRATCFGVARVRRAEIRRQARERSAHAADDMLADAGPEIDWSRLQPMFDDVLGELKERDRAAILLRFFDRKSLAEVGARLSLTETAARSCVDRALEKMRMALARRGVTSTAACVGVALAQQAGVAAPAGLAEAVTGAALAKTAIGGAAGWLGILAMTKVQVGALVALLALGTAGVTWEWSRTRAVAAEVETLRAEHAALAAAPAGSRSATGDVAASGGRSRPNDSTAQARAGRGDDENAGLLAAGMKPLSTWRNAGRATPEAAFETLLWSAFNGDADTLMATYAFTPAAKARLDAWFLTLPPGARAKYGTPERLIAPVVAQDEMWLSRLRTSAGPVRRPVGFKIVGASAPDRGGTVTLQVLFSFSADADRPSRIPMRPATDGWRYGLAGETMVDFFTARIDPETGDVRPRPEPSKPNSP